MTILNAKRKFTPSKVEWPKSKGVFCLIKVLLAVFLIVGLATTLFPSSDTLFTTSTAWLQTIAAKAASKDIENMRNTAYANLPATTVGSCQSPLPSDIQTDISKLKNGCLKRTVTQYSGSPDIKQITVQINWNSDKGAAESISLDTLIYKSGL